MKNVTVPVVPLSKENQIARRILKSSAKESVVRNVIHFDEGGSSKDLKLILLGIGMEKYTDLFIENNVSLNVFLQLDENDLREIGITDTEDLDTITNNLVYFEGRQKKLSVRNNALHYLQIARNVQNELILLQNYCCYLELQMRRQKLTNYRISGKDSATRFLKAFAETAALQAKFLIRRVYYDSGDDHLIGKILKVNDLTLPNHIKDKLIKNKHNGRQKVFFLFSALFGLWSVAVAINYLVK